MKTWLHRALSQVTGGPREPGSDLSSKERRAVSVLRDLPDDDSRMAVLAYFCPSCGGCRADRPCQCWSRG